MAESRPESAEKRYTMSAVQKLFHRFRNAYSADERAVLLLILSLFLSVYLAAACAAAVVIYILVTGKLRETLFGGKGAGYLVLFLAVMLLTTTAYGREFEILVAVGILLCSILVLFMRRVMTQRLFDDLIDTACVMSIWAFAVALLQKLLIRENQFDNRFQSVFVNPNYYAAIIEMVVMFALYKMLTQKRGRLFYTFVIAFNFSGLAICQCRTAFLVIALSVPCLLLFLGRKKLFLLYMVLGVCGALLFFFEPGLFPRSEALGDDFGTRWSIWMASLQGFFDRPMLGGGCYTYSRIYALYGGARTTHAHNIILELLLNYGLLGTGAAAAYIASSARQTLRFYFAKQGRASCALCLTILIGVLAHGMVDATVFWPQTGLLAAAIFACPGIYESKGAAASRLRALRPQWEPTESALLFREFPEQ